MEGVQQLPGELKWLYELGVFLAGLCIGSFLNVVIARVPEGLSIVHPGSRCPQCETPIRWYDNIPVLGWLLLRGRCRDCGKSISLRYPIVELLVGLLALALARRYGFDERVLIYFTFSALLVAISYIDLDHWIIPHVLSWPGIVLGLLFSFINPDLTFSESLIGFIAGFGVFALIGVVGSWVFKKEALGQGDWWLLGLIGAFLGWQALLPVILLASLQGTVVGLLLIVLGRAETGEEEAKDVEEEVEGASIQSPQVASEPSAELEPSESFTDSEQVAVGAGMDHDIGQDAEHSADADKDRGTDSETGSVEDDDEWDDDDWVPPANAIPFGPFLALAGLQYLFFGYWLVPIFGKLFANLTL